MLLHAVITSLSSHSLCPQLRLAPFVFRVVLIHIRCQYNTSLVLFVVTLGYNQLLGLILELFLFTSMNYTLVTTKYFKY